MASLFLKFTSLMGVYRLDPDNPRRVEIDEEKWAEMDGSTRLFFMDAIREDVKRLETMTKGA